MQHDIDTVVGWRKRKVIDRDGDKIGRFEELYLGGGSQRPEWGAVSTGLFGLKHSLIPLHDAQEVGEDIQVPLEAAQVKDAPRVDPDGDLSDEEESRLYSHYGLQRSGVSGGTAEGARGAGRQGGEGRDERGAAGAGTAGSDDEGGRGGEREPREADHAGSGSGLERGQDARGEGDRSGEGDEQGGGRLRRHVVTEEVHHRTVHTEEGEAER